MLDCHFYSLFTFTLLLSFSSLRLCEERTEQEFYFLPYIFRTQNDDAYGLHLEKQFLNALLLGSTESVRNFFLTLLELFLNLQRKEYLGRPQQHNKFLLFFFFHRIHLFPIISHFSSFPFLHYKYQRSSLFVVGVE